MAFQVDPRVIDEERRRQEAAQREQERIRLDDFERQQRNLGYTGPGYQSYEPSAFEKSTGILPPGFRGLTDVKTGELIDRYKIDPFAGEAAQRVKTEALGTGPSPWALMQMDQQKREEAQARSQAGLQSQLARSQAMSEMARVGGLSSGARLALAKQGARGQMASLQDVARAGQQQRFGITGEDVTRRQGLLGQVATAEAGAQAENVNQYLRDMASRSEAEQNRYNQQMQAWAAQQAAGAIKQPEQKKSPYSLFGISSDQAPSPSARYIFGGGGGK